MSPRPTKKLQDEWNSKLKKSGFEDIEQDDDHLSQWHSAYFQNRYTEGEFLAKRAYYSLAGQFLYEHPFGSVRIESIWSLHAEGQSARQIGDHYGLHHNRIDILIKALAAKMLDQIIVREGRETDHSFIYTTWIKGLYSDSGWWRSIQKNVFTSFYSLVIKKMLHNPDVSVRVSCLADDPDIILGYSVSEGNRLHFVFIKPDWRGKGLGILKSLIPKAINEVTSMTKAGKKRMLPDWNYQPFYL